MVLENSTEVREMLRIEWNEMSRVLFCKVEGVVVAQAELEGVNTPTAVEQAKTWWRDLEYDWDGRIHTSFGFVDCN